MKEVLNVSIPDTSIDLEDDPEVALTNVNDSVNANELRYEMNQRQGNLIEIAKKFKKRINSNYLSVTEGKRGAFTIDKDNLTKIIDNTKDKKFKINAEMMNLLGCSKENFYKLMTYMNYKKDKTIDTYIFKGEKKKKEKIIRFDKKENPFNKLLSLNLK